MSEPTASSILELSLVVSPEADRVMFARLEAARRLYNTVLQEALVRLDLMRQSKAWQAARKLPKGEINAPARKARTAAFKACQQHFQFSEYALHAVATKHKNAAGFKNRIGANETQKIGTRVWRAVEEHAFGTRGRPRFKGARQPLKSLEGKSNAAGIRWQPDLGCVVWNKLYLPANLPSATQDPYMAEALQAKTKYCRIVWRQVRGVRRWIVQLVQEGAAPAKYDFMATGERVGIDIGPSTVAIVSEAAVALVRFAPSVEQPWADIRREQRAQDRSRRATNPDNYHANGTVKRGVKQWKLSERYKARAAKLAELERQLAAARKTDHGTLCNQVLGLGTVVQAETLSYLAFQRSFGRSAKVRASGLFMSQLKRKAESAGGAVVDLDTRRLRMSQYDHVVETYVKKPLKQRWHPLGGGEILVQRDCYSAFLAQQVSEGAHNPLQLAKAWTTAEPLLRRAGLCIGEPASGRHPVVPTVAIPSESVARRRRRTRNLSRDAVADNRESPEALCA